ncbi:MAG TPA: amidohydrolase family protein [Candidatus Dormibacteraeota bacterium]|jgi:dihydropyrimidinase/dihydroorotase
MDLLLAGGTVVSEYGESICSVGIEGERIAYVGSASLAPPAAKVVDCTGRYVLPGLIDPHWHIGQQPGPPPPTERWLADVGPETGAAARGGVTTVFSMYARQAPYVPIVRQLIEWGNEGSFVDFNFHPILQSAEHIAEIDELYAMGVTSYKFFFDAYKGWEGDQIALHPVDAGLLHRGLVATAKHGDAVALIHAENQDLIYELQEIARKSGRNDLAVWADSRPGIVELTKAYEAIQIAKFAGAALYIVHIGAAEVADLVEQERRAGHRIFGETCPHYLTHHQDMEDTIGAWGKVNNAIKRPEDAERLWRAIQTGGITNSGTDHVCWSRADKEQGGGKFQNIWRSMPGIVGGTEHWLPAMWTDGVLRGRITPSDLVRVTSTANAKCFGLYPRKGVIAVGSDADIVVFDPTRKVKVDPSTFYASEAASTWSIYEDWEFQGMPVRTYVRGKLVAEDGKLSGRPSGKYIPRPVGAGQPEGSAPEKVAAHGGKTANGRRESRSHRPG